MAQKKRKSKRLKRGVVTRNELSETMREGWRRCGSPRSRKNRKCWSRLLKQAWRDE